MKTLGKLKINTEKVLKNEELVNLKGGYGSGNIKCRCGSEYIYPSVNNCGDAEAYAHAYCYGIPTSQIYCFCN